MQGGNTQESSSTPLEVGGNATPKGGAGPGRGGAAAKGGGGNTNAGRGQGGSKSGAAGARSTAAGATGWTQPDNLGAGSTCSSGTLDGDETDVDCGGSCAPLARCDVGQACLVARDCLTTTCLSKLCAEPIVVVKNSGCVGTTSATCEAPASSLQAKVQLINVGSASLSLKGLEIRYYYTDEAATSTPPVVEVFDKSISTFDISVVAMPTPTPTADHYVKIAYSAGSIAPDLDRVCGRSENSDCADVTFSLHTADYQGTYDPSNDYSFIPSPALANNGQITVHQGTNIIWGTPP